MNRPSIKFRISACFALLSAMLIMGRLPADTSLPMSHDFPPKQQVITFLTDSIDWYRHLAVERQIATDPADLLFLDDNQAIGAQVVRLSFDFARADASLEATSPTPGGVQGSTTTPNASPSDFKNFADLEKQSEDASQQASKDLDSLKKNLRSARGANHKKLEAALAETRSRLELLQARATSLRDLLEFIRATGASPQTGDFASTIDELARSVPEATNPPGLPAELSTRNSNAPSVPQPREPGILSLISEASTLARKRRILDQGTLLTDKLAESSQSLRTPLAGFIKQVVQSSDLETRSLQASDLGLLRQQKVSLDALTVQIKKLPPAIEALDKQRTLLAIHKSHLYRWDASVASQYQKTWKTLILRLALLGIVIAVLAGFGEAARRVTIHYAHDANRRRMILVTERVAMWAAIVLVVAFAFASDLSSFATFFGLLTAGIAVALQNVILAVVGYFMLVGQRGIKIGDRVQISGVAGDVINIGLLQFQLSEVDTQNQFTGRIVTFSNSFVFVSPATGLLKRTPDNSNVSHVQLLTEEVPSNSKE